MQNDSKKTKGAVRLGLRPVRNGAPPRDSLVGRAAPRAPLTALEMFEQQSAWIAREYLRLRQADGRQQSTRNAIAELLQRNRQLGREFTRWMERQGAI